MPFPPELINIFCSMNWITARVSCLVYGRTLGDVFVCDGINVNHTLVKDGWCWWYWKYAPGDTVLEGLEREAREAKKGLWVIRTPCRRGSGESGNRISGRLISWRWLAWLQPA